MERRDCLKGFGAGLLVLALPTSDSPAPTAPKATTAAPPRYRGTTVISIDESLRILRPKQFRAGSPFCTIGVTLNDGSQVLALCETSMLPRFAELFGRHWCVLSEHRAGRARLPQVAFERFGLAPATQAVLIGSGCWLELCSKEQFEAGLMKSEFSAGNTAAYVRALFA